MFHPPQLICHVTHDVHCRSVRVPGSQGPVVVLSISNLPESKDVERIGSTKSCHLRAHSVKQNLALSFVSIPSSCAVSVRPLRDFLHFTCSILLLHHEDGKPASFQGSADYNTGLFKMAHVPILARVPSMAVVLANERVSHASLC